MNSNSPDEQNMSSITSNEWLNLSWNYFQLHAQQRISYFNFFVVFSTILTTGLITTYQTDFKIPFLGIFIGILQSFVSYIFLKIDLRNKLLTGNAETVIKKIEFDFNTLGKESFSLFTNEESLTQQLKVSSKNRFFLFRHLTHGEAYRIIYSVFFIIGILMSCTSMLITFTTQNKTSHEKNTLHNTNRIKVLEKHCSDTAKSKMCLHYSSCR